MKRIIAICLSFILLIGIFIPSFAADTKIDKAHLAFFQSYMKVYNEFDAKSLEKFYGSKSFSKEEMEELEDGFLTLSGVRDAGFVKFYMSDNIKLFKYNPKTKLSIYNYDLYSVLYANDQVYMLKTPITMGITKNGKTFKVVTHTRGNEVTLTNSGEILPKILEVIDKDFKDALGFKLSDVSVPE